MIDEVLQKTAFLYGRNAEQLRRTDANTDEAAYREYRELCFSLWKELKENGATDGANLKPDYLAYEQAGRDSVVEC
jgi:hypothetical protein